MIRARDNPFATCHVLRVRYRPLDEDLPGILCRLRAGGFRGAIVGPRGSGKTTLLEDLAALLPVHGMCPVMVRWDTDQRRLAPAGGYPRRLGPGHVLLLDGAEAMGRLRWRLLRGRSRRWGGLLITSHRAGLLPTLVQCRTTPEVLGHVVRQLLGDRCDLGDDHFASLHARHGGNIREALRELYDQWGRRREP